MNTIFMNFKNSKTSDPHKLLLNLTEKINLKKSDKICCFIKSWHILYMKEIITIKKSHIRTINLKYQLQHRTKKVVLNIS